MSAWLENWEVCGPPLANGAATPLLLSFEDREWMHRTFERCALERMDVMLCRETAISDRVLIAQAAHGTVPLTFYIPNMRFEFAALEPKRFQKERG